MGSIKKPIDPNTLGPFWRPSCQEHTRSQRPSMHCHRLRVRQVSSLPCMSGERRSRRILSECSRVRMEYLGVVTTHCVARFGRYVRRCVVKLQYLLWFVQMLSAGQAATRLSRLAAHMSGSVCCWCAPMMQLLSNRTMCI